MLTANQQSINLGNLPYGIAHQFKFVLTNRYSQPITIVDLKAGCASCTTAVASKSIVGPYDTVDLNVTFTPGSTGANKKYINIFYSKAGVGMPQYEVSFTATVK